MIRNILRSRLFLLFVSMFLIGFLIGYNFSMITSRDTGAVAPGVKTIDTAGTGLKP